MGQEINVSFDGTLDIATGRSRKETNWKNKEISWADLVKRVSKTHNTAETFSEYLAAKKPRQDEIKDIGGFVGGYLSGGKRKSSTVSHRQIITLDLDFATPGTWDDFTLLFGYAACVYSTHKHSPDKPRLRLLIPIDRPVPPDEYEAIARKLAEDIGIELFDQTTYEPSRLMYWPSTAADGEFFTAVQDGPWIKADEILGRYRNWKDLSEWPLSERNSEIVLRAMKKQGDPLQKTNWVGAFCRAYTITQVIDDVLADVYESTDIEDRYTYRGGSTAAGLVIYDDKYAFSHHGTDPVSGKLCNAFDLVRLHKYGILDEDVKEGTPPNRLPSYKAMLNFAAKDPATIREMATMDFEGEGAESVNEKEWMREQALEFDRNEDGGLKNTIHNFYIIIKYDPWLTGRFAFDLFGIRELVMRQLKWRDITDLPAQFKEVDDAAIRHYIEKKYKIESPKKLRDAMLIIINENSFHPVKDYLHKIPVWDGVSRLDVLFINYLGAKDTVYHRTVARKAFVAAIARVMQPGVKFDYVLTLVGKQGIGKSTILKILGGKWFSDSLTIGKEKESYIQLQGAWIIEIGELVGLNRADLNLVKHFISKPSDTYRMVYERINMEYPRQCVFFATTNDEEFLRDRTGNRRFWVVDTNPDLATKNIFKDLTPAERDQIWAEALHLYKAGETLYLSPEIEAMAAEIQENYTEKDHRFDAVQDYLNIPVPADWWKMGIYDRQEYLDNDFNVPRGGDIQQKVCVTQIWCEVMGGRKNNLDRKNCMDIHNIMRKMKGWEAYATKTAFGVYGNGRGYQRVHKMTAKTKLSTADVCTN